MKDALINKTIVTLYGEPHFDSLVGQAVSSTIQDEGLYGMPVEIIELCPNEWVKVRTHYRYEGYVPLEDLWLITEKEKLRRRSNHLQVIRHSYVDVLSLPKVQGVRLQVLTRGAIVTLVEEAKEEGGWTKIRLNDGKEGYVKAGFLAKYYDEPSSEDEVALRKNIVDTALSYIGTQYRWGGKSTLGIDCSGLCSLSYLLNGVIIYRDAKIKEGFQVHEIDFKDKRPGDLLYYKGHMTMYIGDDLYVHATAKNGSDGVVINSLDPMKPNYRADLAKRIVAVGSIFNK